MPRLLLFALLTTGLLSCSSAKAENWPGWRGPRGDGSSMETQVPTQWDGPSGKNIAWKVPIPGIGHASPIVWQNQVFVASCITDRQERVLLCLDRRSGKTLWRRTVLKAPLETKHSLNSFASST
ncbi:MAG: PQQ-binding-like beta-propeller repeat protein, partial [Planctomycetaceae bacterium]